MLVLIVFAQNFGVLFVLGRAIFISLASQSTTKRHFGKSGIDVGIGTSAPYTKLHVLGTIKTAPTNQSGVVAFGGTTDTTTQLGIFRGTANSTSDGNWLNMAGYEGLTFSVSAANIGSQTERMRINNSGNVGIGTINPQFRLEVDGPLSFNDAAGRNMLVASTDSANVGYGGGIAFGGFYDGTSSFLNDFAGIQGFKENGTQGNYSGALRFTTRTNGGNPTERMRITSAGEVLINTTNSVDSGILQVAYDSGVNNGIIFRTGGTGSQYAAIFRNGNGTVGSITTNASATAYNTSSDYRLKENITSITGALATVAQLKPVTYKWKTDGSDGQGFIAHELAEVVPDCVTGEKDAVDKDGKPVYQGVDTSFLVATLTAAIQEQQALIESLTERLTALEGK